MRTQPASIRIVAAAAAVVSALALAHSARAQVIVSSPLLPVFYPPGFYTNLSPVPGPVYLGPGLSVALQNEAHKAIPPVISRVPSGPDEIETFNSELDAMASVNGGPFVPLTLNGQVQTIVHNKIGNTTGTYNTEMLSMNLSGNTPFGPIMIRESPTLASTGQTSITDIGGGLYRIDSFFDVFTELSVDGGATWMPDSQGPAHVVLMPEPSALTFVGLGVLVFLRRRGGRC